MTHSKHKQLSHEKFLLTRLSKKAPRIIQTALNRDKKRRQTVGHFTEPNINDPTAGSPTVTLLRLLLPPIVLVQ